MKFQKYQKLIFVLSIIGLLSLAFVFFYNDNKKREVAAQEDFVLDCGEEIPIGEATDEALQMVNNIVINSEEILSRSGQQVRLANRIDEMDITVQCLPGNCTTLQGCTGNACPTDLLTELADSANRIQSLYPRIQANKDAIHDEIDKRDDILDKLTAAREMLDECATPASGYVPEETLQLIEGLVSCENAKFYKILPEDKENCYPSNFFCCRPRRP